MTIQFASIRKQNIGNWSTESGEVLRCRSTVALDVSNSAQFKGALLVLGRMTV